MTSIQLLQKALTHCNQNYIAAAPSHSVLTVQWQLMSMVLFRRVLRVGPSWLAIMDRWSTCFVLLPMLFGILQPVLYCCCLVSSSLCSIASSLCTVKLTYQRLCDCKHLFLDLQDTIISLLLYCNHSKAVLGNICWDDCLWSWVKQCQNRSRLWSELFWLLQRLLLGDCPTTMHCPF